MNNVEELISKQQDSKKEKIESIFSVCVCFSSYN